MRAATEEKERNKIVEDRRRIAEKAAADNCSMLVTFLTCRHLFLSTKEERRAANAERKRTEAHTKRRAEKEASEERRRREREAAKKRKERDREQSRATTKGVREKLMEEERKQSDGDYQDTDGRKKVSLLLALLLIVFQRFSVERYNI